MIGRELEPVNTSWLSLLLLLGLELVIELELDVVSAAETSARSKSPRRRMRCSNMTSVPWGKSQSKRHRIELMELSEIRRYSMSKLEDVRYSRTVFTSRGWIRGVVI